MQILDEDEEGLDLALAQEEPLDTIEDALAALWGVEPFPPGIVDGNVEEGQESRQPGLELAVQGEKLAGRLLADPPAVIAGLDLEVALQQVDDGQVGGSLTVGDGAGLEDEPVRAAVGMSEFPVEAGLAHAGLADDRHELTVSAAGALESLAELGEFGVAADEAAETPRGSRMKPRADGSSPDQLVDVHGPRKALYRDWTEGFDLEISLGEPQCLASQQDGAGIGELLHAPRQMRRLTHGAVVHVQVAPDRAHDHFAGI